MVRYSSTSRFASGVMRSVAAACLALSVACAEAVAKDNAETEARNKTLIEESFDAWAAGKGGPMGLLADDVVWTFVGRSLVSRTYKGKETFLNEVIRPFGARMSVALKPELLNIYADGDTVIAVFEGRGEARDGKPYVNTYAWFLDMKDGKIVKASAFLDSIEIDELWTRVSP